MLTLYYVAATWLQSWRLNTILSKIKEIRKKNGSIVLHQEVPPYVYMVRSGKLVLNDCYLHLTRLIKDVALTSSDSL